MKKHCIKNVVICVLICLSAVFVCGGCDTTVETPPSVVLNEEKLKMEVGSYFDFSATCVGTEEEVVWISYDAATVSIDENGRATALQAGETTVVAQAGAYSGSCDVLVIEPTVQADNLSIQFAKSAYTLDANEQDNAAQLEVFVYLNGEELTTQLEWSSSDDELVAVTQGGVATAVKNGGTAYITATAKVNGETISAVCKITTEPFAVIVVEKENVTLYPQEQDDVLFEVYIDGQPVGAADKVKTLFYSLDESVAKVNANGRITAVNTGTTQIAVQYGGKVSYVDVQVGTVSYVATANQLMEIANATALQRYVLTQDIDMSEYCKRYPLIDSEYVFEKFDGELIGNGHTVSGFHRFSTSNDEGFSGIFKELGKTSLLKNVAFSGVIENAHAGSLLALNAFGRVEDCIFTLSGITGFSNEFNALFELHNGSVQNTVVKILYNGGVNGTFTLSPNGYGAYENVSVIADAIVVGGYISGFDSQLNERFTRCTWYSNEEAFVNKNGYRISGIGKGDLVDFGVETQFDDEVFKVLDGTVVLRETENLVSYPTFSVNGYQDVFLGQSMDLHTPEESIFRDYGATIINQNGENVTSSVCYEGKFVADRTGTYYVVHYVCENGYYGFSLKQIKVLQNKPSINVTKLTLKPQDTFDIQIDGMTNDNFIFVSSDESVAAVDGDGRIQAKSDGAASVSVYSKTGSIAYTVYLSVLTEYTEIATVDEFIELLTSAKTGDKFVLVADIHIPKDRVITTEDKLDSPARSYVIENFYGILDGQGYTVSLEMQTTKGICGLFRTVCRKAEIRNLKYDADIYYTPYNRVPYGGAFCYTFSGYMENCYLKSDFYSTSLPTDQEGIIAVAACESGFGGTSEIHGCIFEIHTEYDGQAYDNGYAIRAGTSPVITVYDSVLIKNGLQADFYSGPVGGSAVQLSHCYTYKTLYDFVHAKQGKEFSTTRVATVISDGAHVYANWNSVWEIEKDGVYLCGKKATDVAFVKYITPKTMQLTDDFGEITWVADSAEYEIYVNEILCGKTQDNFFNVQDYVLQTYGVAEAQYNVFVKGDGVAGVSVYEVVHLTQANFLAQLRAVDTKEAAANKLFVLTEDVKVNWKDFVNYGSSGKNLFNVLYANVDGRGCCVQVTVDTNGENFTSVIGNAYGVWRNTYFNVYVTYVPDVAKERRILAGSYVEGAFVNNYVSVTVNPIDGSGNGVKDGKVCVIGSTYGTAENRNNVYHLNVADETNETLIYVYGAYSSLGPTMNNCAVIRNHGDIQLSMGYVIDQNGTPLSCEKRIIDTGLSASVADFIKGAGYVISREIDITEIKGETAVYEENKQIYKKWDSVWAIEEGRIALCGRTILAVVEVGDDSVQDGLIGDLQNNA